MQHGEHLSWQLHHRALQIREEGNGGKACRHGQALFRDNSVAHEGCERSRRGHPVPDEGDEDVDKVGLDTPPELRLSRFPHAFAPAEFCRNKLVTTCEYTKGKQEHTPAIEFQEPDVLEQLVHSVHPAVRCLPALTHQLSSLSVESHHPSQTNTTTHINIVLRQRIIEQIDDHCHGDSSECTPPEDTEHV